MDMKRFMKDLKKYLLYGGIEKYQYKMISSEIDKSNRKSIIILSSAFVFVFALRLCLTYSAVPDVNRVIFLNAILLFGILAVGNILISDNHHFVHISAYLFLAFFLSVGILSSIGSGSIHERTTLYLVFIAVAPMLYALNAIELTAIIAPAEIIYLILIAKFQSSYPVYATNQGNTLFCSICGLLLGIYMTNMKISGIYNTYINARDNQTEHLNKQLAFSRQELQSALSLIKEVLDTDQVENKNIVLTKSSICIPELLDDIQAITQNEISKRQINLSVEYLDITNKNVMGDNLRLQQILLNVLTYVIKFTPIGGDIRFLVIQRSSPLMESADYEFQIITNDPAPLSTINEIEDSNLGMLIAKNIIDIMGGTITVNTHPNEGSRFIISMSFSI